jgi:hypothetical protein
MAVCGGTDLASGLDFALSDALLDVLTNLAKAVPARRAPGVADCAEGGRDAARHVMGVRRFNRKEMGGEHVRVDCWLYAPC